MSCNFLYKYLVNVFSNMTSGRERLELLEGKINAEIEKLRNKMERK